jgi:hypothetical protein
LTVALVGLVGFLVLYAVDPPRLWAHLVTWVPT